jgi:hypothetical protein
LIWTRIVFLTGQVIFVPEWPKRKFVSIIGLILFGQNHLYVKDAVLQGIPLFRRFCLQVRKSPVLCQPSGQSCHPIWMPIYPLFHPSGRRAIPSRCPTNQASSVRTTCHSIRTHDRPSIIRPDDVTFCPDAPLYREASVPACIRPDVSAARPDASQRSISFRFFPSSI